MDDESRGDKGGGSAAGGEELASSSLKCDWVYEFVSMVQDEKEMDVPSPNEFDIVKSTELLTTKLFLIDSTCPTMS